MSYSEFPLPRYQNEFSCETIHMERRSTYLFPYYANRLIFTMKGLHQGRVVRKPVNVNPGLNVYKGIKFSCIKMFFTSNVWCSLRLLQLKTEGQTI